MRTVKIFSIGIFALPLIGLAVGTTKAKAVLADTTDESTASKESEPPKKSKNNAKKTVSVVAVFSLGGAITEAPRADDFLFQSTRSESLKDLLTRMQQAHGDERVRAVVILLGNASYGAAQAEEIRDMIEQLQAAGKPVHAHAESISTRTYLILSGASDLSVVPTASVFLTGIYVESPYARDLLAKIGVIPDFLTCGDYKTAAEVFMRKNPSPQAEQMMSWLFDSLYETYVSLFAVGRDVTTEKVRSWIDQALYTAAEAKDAGIIDAVEYRQDFVTRLKIAYGDDLIFDKKYGKKKREDVDFSSPFGMFKMWSEWLQGRPSKKAHQDTVAIVYVDGPIMLGKPNRDLFANDEVAYSTPIRNTLDSLAKDDAIKAVVLRVNSPGGSAVASEIILNATQRVKAKKPLVVSMGNVAGSGGYYVACGADTIFADASTITGSIGVVGGKFATAKMWDKLGVSWKATKRGANAELMSSKEVFSKQQRDKFQAWMNTTYTIFKEHVVKSRGDRLNETINQLSGGRVYTGNQALQRGLVDRLGGLEDAIKYVAQQAKLQKDAYRVRVAPQPKSFMELLFHDLSGEEEENDEHTLSLPQSNGHCFGLLFERALPLISGLEPHRVRAIKMTLLKLEMLGQENLLMMMPEISIHD